MKMPRRELSIDMVIHRVIITNNQITPFPCFTYIPKTGVGFYCAPFIKNLKTAAFCRKVSKISSLIIF